MLLVLLMCPFVRFPFHFRRTLLMVGAVGKRSGGFAYISPPSIFRAYMHNRHTFTTAVRGRTSTAGVGTEEAYVSPLAAGAARPAPRVVGLAVYFPLYRKKGNRCSHVSFMRSGRPGSKLPGKFTEILCSSIFLALAHSLRAFLVGGEKQQRGGITARHNTAIRPHSSLSILPYPVLGSMLVL